MARQCGRTTQSHLRVHRWSRQHLHCLRHHRKQCGVLNQPLAACLFVSGFDIPHQDEDAYNRAYAKIEETLSGTELELIGMASNHKDVNPYWDHTHAAGIISCLALLNNRFDRAVIGSTYTYHELGNKWGSNALTDGLSRQTAYKLAWSLNDFTQSNSVKEGTIASRPN